jgi:hypothetical protein
MMSHLQPDLSKQGSAQGKMASYCCHCNVELGDILMLRWKRFGLKSWNLASALSPVYHGGHSLHLLGLYFLTSLDYSQFSPTSAG